MRVLRRFRNEASSGVDTLLERLPTYANEFRTASPFPYIVVDDAVDERSLERVRRTFPTSSEMTVQFNGHHEVKSAENNWQRIPSPIRSLLSELNSDSFIDALEGLSGIKGLIADTRLIGGGFTRSAVAANSTFTLTSTTTKQHGYIVGSMFCSISTEAGNRSGVAN